MLVNSYTSLLQHGIKIADKSFLFSDDYLTRKTHEASVHKLTEQIDSIESQVYHLDNAYWLAQDPLFPRLEPAGYTPEQQSHYAFTKHNLLTMRDVLLEHRFKYSAMVNKAELKKAMSALESIKEGSEDPNDKKRPLEEFDTDVFFAEAPPPLKRQTSFAPHIDA